jgi:hypothetical protein
MEIEKRRKLGATNKRKGSNCERKYRLIFRSLGFSKCETSRYANKLYDACKIDLVNLPFNVQIKAGRQKNMNPGKELHLMYLAIRSGLEDEVLKKPQFLIHEQETGRGFKRVEEDTKVYFTLRQFNDFKERNSELRYDSLSIYKNQKVVLEEEFRSIVYVTFEYFKSNILPIIKK